MSFFVVFLLRVLFFFRGKEYKKYKKYKKYDGVKKEETRETNTLKKEKGNELIKKNNNNLYNLSIVSNSNLISFQTSQAEANSGLHLAAARIMSPPSRARLRPSLRA